MRGPDEPSLADAIKHQPTHPAFAAWRASEDVKEGPRAFAEKRPPRWPGRWRRRRDGSDAHEPPGRFPNLNELHLIAKSDRIWDPAVDVRRALWPAAQRHVGSSSGHRAAPRIYNISSARKRRLSGVPPVISMAPTHPFLAASRHAPKRSRMRPLEPTKAT